VPAVLLRRHERHDGYAYAWSGGQCSGTAQWRMRGLMPAAELDSASPAYREICMIQVYNELTVCRWFGSDSWALPSLAGLASATVTKYDPTHCRRQILWRSVSTCIGDLYRDLCNRPRALRGTESW